MSDEEDEEPREDDEEAGVSLDEVDVRDLLRAALKPPPAKTEELTRAVQKKIRTETKGAFFSDGWSISRSPRETYLITSLVMLAMVILAYLLLGPYGL